MMIGRLIQTALITISSGACLTQAPTFNNDEKVNINNNLVIDNVIQIDLIDFVYRQNNYNEVSTPYTQEFNTTENTTEVFRSSSEWYTTEKYEILIRRVEFWYKIPTTYTPTTTIQDDGSITFLGREVIYISLFADEYKYQKITLSNISSNSDIQYNIGENLENADVYKSIDSYAYGYQYNQNSSNNSPQAIEIMNKCHTANFNTNTYYVSNPNRNQMTRYDEHNIMGEIDGAAQTYSNTYLQTEYEVSYELPTTKEMMIYWYIDTETEYYNVSTQANYTETLYRTNNGESRVLPGDETITIREYRNDAIDSESGGSGTINYEYVDIPGLMYSIIAMPFTFISQAFNLTLFPNTPWEVNVAYIMQLIIIVLITIFIVRLIMRGGGS